MTCTDVQNALWVGKKSDEVLQHIETCFACQKESAEIQQILGNLRAIEIPAPTRSLVPSSTIIRETVQKNRRKPLKRISTIAAAATVLLAIGTGIVINSYKLPSEIVQGENNKQWIATVGNPDVPPIEIREGAGNPEMLAAIQKYLAKNTSVKEITSIKILDFIPSGKEPKLIGYVSLEVKLQPGVTSSTFINTDRAQNKNVVLVKQPDGTWSVAAFDYDKGPDIKDRIQLYFERPKKSGRENGIKQVKILEFTPDPQTEEKIMTGKVTFDAELEAGVQSQYKQGRNEKFLLLVKRQGVWDVDLESTSPLPVEQAPVYYRDFEKVAQIIFGTISEVKIYTFEYEGRTITKLQSLIVDKNLTPSAGTIAPGQTIEVVFEEEMTKDMQIHLKNGTRIVLFTAQTDPALVMGATLWHSDLNYYFYEQNGKYYDLRGNTTDPLIYYKKMQSAKK